MIKKRILILLLILIPGRAFSQNFNFTNFNAENGLIQNYVYSILQDEHGYLWVGTGNGLSRYNGFRFDNFTTADSLSDNFVTCGISAFKGIWFGHNNGGLSYFDGSRFRKIKIPLSDPGRITHFGSYQAGEIWGSTASGTLFKLSADSGVTKYFSFKTPEPILSFSFISKQEFLAGTNSGLLYCTLKNTGEIEIVKRLAEIPETRISGIIEKRSNKGFYVATENEGLFAINFTGTSYTCTKINPAQFSEFTSIQDIYEDSMSNLWLCSFGKGLIKLSPSGQDTFTHNYSFNASDGFIEDNVKTVFEDREGNIWSGNYSKGLTQITSKTFSAIKFENKETGNDIFSFCYDQKYRWIGSSNGLIKIDILTGKVLRVYGKGSGIPKDTITSVATADGRKIWIGTFRNGLFSFDPVTEKFIKYPLGDGLLENSITAVNCKGNEVWVGTKKGLCNINQNTNKTIWYTLSRGGLPHNLINCIYNDKENRVWVSTRSNVLVYISDGIVHKIPLVSSSGVSTIGPVTEDSKSRIWVGTNGNGVFMIRSDSIVNLTVKEGLFSNYCYSLICDDNSNLWVGHKGGLSRIRTGSLSIKPVQHIDGSTENFQFNPNAVMRENNGKIWFGSNRGIVMYDPSMENKPGPPPLIVFTSLRINDQERPVTDKIVLSPGNYKITIDFLGISLKEPSLVTYQYKLTGYDQWSEISKNTSVTYNHLAAGEYTFLLNSSSGDGAVTKAPLAINIIIKKPIWKNLWFFPALTLLTAFLVILYIKRREHRFLSEKRILEEKVMERTSEIQAQKNEIERQRDLIDEKNANITSSIKYASQIQNTVLPQGELIDRLFPENFILNKPKDIVSGDFYWLAEKNGKIVFTVADCTGHGVPGAFMSLLGITFLNEIVNMQGILQSAAIVTELRERVIHTLRQSGDSFSTSDGMDIALCVLDREKKKIQYTGGMNDLVYIRDNELKVVKADRTSVCVLYNSIGLFTMKEFEFRKGDMFYLCSDGYKDQFGGTDDKKLRATRFYKILLEIHKLPMHKQKDILEERLAKWMMDTDQTDDITILGVRL